MQGGVFMKSLLLIKLLAIVLSIPTLGQSKAERTVIQLTKEYSKAIARRDASVHERLFAKYYTYTPGNGNFMGRDEHMNFTKKGGLTVDSLQNEEMVVRVYRKTAIVTGL